MIDLMRMREQGKSSFVGRDDILGFFSDSLASLRSGVEKNIAIVGERGIGKSALLERCYHLTKEHADIIPIFVSLERMPISPENFAQEFAGSVLFWHQSHKNASRSVSAYSPFKSLAHQRAYLEQNNFSEALAKLAAIENELQKIKPDQKLLLSCALEMPAAIARDTKQRCVVLLDDFDDLLALNNFDQIKDVFSVMRFTQRNVCFVAAMRKEHGVSFVVRRIEALTRQESSAFIRGVIPTADAKLDAALWQCCEGMPWLLTSMLRLVAVRPTVPLPVLLSKALLTVDDPLSLTVQRSYERALSSARGETLLRTVMLVLANNNVDGRDLRLTDVSRLIYRSAPVTKIMLERLAAVGLVAKSAKTYSVANKTLALWLRLQPYSGNEPSDEDVIALLAQIGGGQQ